MAHIPINQHLLQVCEAIDTRDRASCAKLVSFKHPHVANHSFSWPVQCQ
uniref:Uncharacterized protein n=1 Tax=Rhinolophus ferrumequinum TaxID=59479 RepID=A0A671E5P5_RHIFE